MIDFIIIFKGAMRIKHSAKQNGTYSSKSKMRYCDDK